MKILRTSLQPQASHEIGTRATVRSNPSIERTGPAKPGHVSHLER